jgi:hypothetical protein
MANNNGNGKIKGLETLGAIADLPIVDTTVKDAAIDQVVTPSKYTANFPSFQRPFVRLGTIRKKNKDNMNRLNIVMRVLR